MPMRAAIGAAFAGLGALAFPLAFLSPGLAPVILFASLPFWILALVYFVLAVKP